MGLSFHGSNMALMLVILVLLMATINGAGYRLWYSTPWKHPNIDLSAKAKNVIHEMIGVYDGLNEESSLDEDEEMEHACFGNDSWCMSYYYNTADSGMSLRVSMRRDQDDAVTVDIELSAETVKLARSVLVDTVPILDFHFEDKNIDKKQHAVWSIQHQPALGEKALPTSPSSLDSVVLSDSFLLQKKRLASHDGMEIWQYVENGNTVKALFHDTHLHSITTPAGHAHAEAMVHPAMIAHPNPQRIAILSQAPPISILQEVLKHKTVQEVHLVGTTSIEKYDLVRTHFMDQGWSGTTCLEQASTKVIIKRAESWLNFRVALLEEGFDEDEEVDEYFDVILMDVSPGNEEWLSLEMQSLVMTLLTNDGIAVVNTGSAPPLQTSYDSNSKLSAREQFLFHATKQYKYRGLEYDALLLYDEDMAKPLDSTFLVAFPDQGEPSYRRFVRKNAPAIDVEIVERFNPSENNQLPTLLFDGPTHVKYLTNSRAWETWYCNTAPSKSYCTCKEFLVTWYDASYHHYNTEVRRNPTKGRSLHTLEAVPRNHFVLPHAGAPTLRIDATQLEALEQFATDFPDAAMYQELQLFLNAYGYEISQLGGAGWAVAIACNSTFINHACTEKDLTVEYVRDINEHGDWNGFSPVTTRRTELISSLAVARRDIQAGEEITTNYTSFRNGDDPDFFAVLRSMCQGGPGGLVPLDEKEQGNKESVGGKEDGISDEL